MNNMLTRVKSKHIYLHKYSDRCLTYFNNKIIVKQRAPGYLFFVSRRANKTPRN